MNRYTVVWSTAAQDRLAELWLGAVNRQWVTNAANYIEQVLQQDPYRGSMKVSDNLYELVVAPLTVAFAISEADCKVTVTGVKLVSLN